MIHATHENKSMFFDEAANIVLPRESFGVGLELLFVLRSMSSLMFQKGFNKVRKASMHDDVCSLCILFDDFWIEVLNGVTVDRWFDGELVQSGKRELF